MVDIKILKWPRVEATVTQRKFFKKTARGTVIKGMFSNPSVFASLIWLQLGFKFFASDISETMFPAE